jgi:hypothetical protein
MSNVAHEPSLRNEKDETPYNRRRPDCLQIDDLEREH